MDEQLQRLLGVTVPARYADALTQRLDAFALAGQEQALEVDLCPMAAGDDPEVGSELGDVLLDSLDNARVQLHYRHAPHIATPQHDGKILVVRFTFGHVTKITSQRCGTRGVSTPNDWSRNHRRSISTMTNHPRRQDAGSHTYVQIVRDDQGRPHVQDRESIATGPGEGAAWVGALGS